jgi:O-Antigen ligase
MTPSLAAQSKAWGATAVVCCLMIATGAAVSQTPLVAGVAVGLAMVALTLMFPVAGLITALVFGVLQYSLTKAYPVLPSSFTLTDDVIVAALFLRWLGSVGLRRTTPPVWFSFWIAVWLTVGVANVVAGGLSAVWSLEAFRSMFLPLMLYPIASEFAGREKTLRLILRVIVALTLFGSAIAIWQAFAGRAIGDRAFGFLSPGGANILGFLSLLGAIILLSAPKPSSRYLVAAGVMLAAIVASAARAALIVTPLVILLTLRGRSAKVARVVALLAVLVTGGYLVAAVFWASGLSPSTSLSPGRLVSAQDNANFGGRLLYARALPELFQGDPVNWLVGLGPGQYVSVVGVQREAHSYMAARPASITSGTGYASADNEWVAIVGEYGVAGILCVLMILARPVYLALFRSGPLIDLSESQQTLARATPAVVCIGVMAAMIVNAFEYQPFAYALWVLLGLSEWESS